MRSGRQPAIPDDAWFKSSYSSAGPTECVEAALLERGTAVRDSKSPGRPGLWFGQSAWSAFTRELREGALEPF
ncbi:DUF397 domain-containing protein [Streptomyces sp. S07_1.15]|uniref:DUF397 domain-containing protein n=1 Tax=Streptomyces sp. S07_1.15 TaxID=2873925 RepID=UPI001D13BA77|nr:DUF397 domain-containing protein [Streptomyces sp. S07_1.15]MCC3653718.1 DUF397 domain-containing protein [Streptomyces sp. S07_1.15]